MKRSMHRKLLIPVILLLVATVALELLNIHLSQQLASDSVDVKRLQESIARYDETNQILNAKLLEQTSFENISKKATAMGFVQSSKYISLHTPNLSYSR